jgi:protein-L-isoaspartate(D-aspartate) O-methyltransferase
MAEDEFEQLRQQLMAEIETEAALTVGHTGRASFSERVMRVIGSMPRHEFVPVELQPYAYLNRPLPIGYEKTVSQPFIVALMTDLLAPEATRRRSWPSSRSASTRWTSSRNWRGVPNGG